MSASPKPPSDRSVHIGGNASGNVIQTGDHNTASVRYRAETLPAPESVDIRAELEALRQRMAQLQSPDTTKIANAFSDAEDELSKAEPDKDEIGKAVERALGYATHAETFAQKVESLKPHVVNVASWLGSAWHGKKRGRIYFS